MTAGGEEGEGTKVQRVVFSECVSQEGSMRGEMLML